MCLDLEEFILTNEIDAELIKCEVPMKSAALAVNSLGLPFKKIFKSVFLVHKISKHNRDYVLVVLPSSCHVDLEKLAVLLDWNLRKISFANSEETLRLTGYPSGGIPPLGHHAGNFRILIDEGIFLQDFGFVGGGKPEWVVKIKPNELVRAAEITAISVIIGDFSMRK